MIASNIKRLREKVKINREIRTNVLRKKEKNMKGRKKIPTKIIDIMGGSRYTHRPPRTNEPMPPEKMPACPAHLDQEAKKEWTRTGKLLMDVGLLTDLDRSVLAAYCDAYSRWVAATKKCQEVGMVFQRRDGTPVLNPYLRIARESYDQMLKAGTLIGMSPSSRASLKVEQPKKKQNADEEKRNRFFK